MHKRSHSSANIMNTLLDSKTPGLAAAVRKPIVSRWFTTRLAELTETELLKEVT